MVPERTPERGEVVLGLRFRPASGNEQPRDPLRLEPIGYVQNRVRRPLPSGWEQVESQLVITLIDAEEMLRGLEAYSHVVVVFWIDRLGIDRPRPTALRPGGPATPVQGVLATRSQLRPNPLGMSVVALRAIKGPRLQVIGLDAIDGTPVLDVKPYVPFYDSVPDARVPDWILASSAITD